MRHRHHLITVAACLLLVTQFGCGGGDSPAPKTAGNPLDGKLEGVPADSQNGSKPSGKIQQVFFNGLCSEVKSGSDCQSGT